MSALQKRPSCRHVFAFVVDLLAAASAFAAAYLTVVGYPAILAVPTFPFNLFGFVAAAAIVYSVFKPYRGSWRYASIPDLNIIVLSAGSLAAAYTAGMFFLSRGTDIPRLVPILSVIYLIMAMAGARLTYRIIVEQSLYFPGAPKSEEAPTINVILCGFSGKAESFIRSTRRSTKNRFSVVGIIDDTKKNVGRTIQGVKVLGGLATVDIELAKLNRRGIEVSELVITEAEPSRARVGEIVERANEMSLKVSRIPDLTDMAQLSSSLLLEPKPIELEDLLERPEFKRSVADVARLIRGKVVLATGAGGSIGSELCRQIVTFSPQRLVITDHSEFHLYKLDKELREKYPDIDIATRIVDVRDRSRVSDAFTQYRPEVVFHAAALKHVPLMEANPLEAVKTNILGTKNVADAALQSKSAIFVMISTDKAVNPTNIMGATKRAAEVYCQSLDVTSFDTRFKTVRFGNVLGSNGSVVPRFQEQIAAGGPVTVTHPEIVRYFMTIPEAVSLVLKASGHAMVRQHERGKIMVLEMGKPVRIADLAKRMILLAGYVPGVDIEIEYTGLRPGEKLYEELFDIDEVTEGSADEGYVIAAPRVVDRRLVEDTFEEMQGCLGREDVVQAIEILRRIVPEFVHAGTPPLKI